jgi:ATP-dependent DNA helicase RecQ
MNLLPVLEKYWGYSSFRPMQEEIMQKVLTGNDVLAILPTGGGKSICFQVPAMATEGLCIVVTPLVALMQDQVNQLKKRGIAAYAIHTGMDYRTLNHIFQEAINGRCKFLYVSPERLETRLFREYLPGLPLSLIAIDEAHCISQWGYDFRPSYLKIASIREEKPGIPVLALTASATQEVQHDIREKLKMKNAVVFRQSFERANLSYSKFSVESKYAKLVHILQKVKGSGIVYCRSRKRTKEVAELLQQHQINATFYHAGLSAAQRKERQEQWITGQVRIMASTNAFGMGIDKADVRIVVHIDTPDCIENYYQEAGRAGRDQKKAYAVLLFQQNEKEELLKQPAIRFPEIEVIRNVYNALVNYLQVPTGSGDETYYDLDLNDFCKRFNLNPRQAMYSLQALEQSSVVSYHDQLFTPPTVCFTTSKEQLEEIEKSRPQYDKLIKALLRSYGGIFDFPSPISEKQLAKTLQWQSEEVKKGLETLHKAKILYYLPQQESPQIRFLQPRVSAAELTIDLAAYQKRKEVYTQRVKDMIAFVFTDQCRAVFIGKYFGDEKIMQCGVCDNCIERKKKEATVKQFGELADKISGVLETQSMTMKEIIMRLPEIREENILMVIEEWEKEQKLQFDTDGKIRLKKKGQDRNPARF